MTVNVRDATAGALFVGIGGWFAFSALNLDIGTAFRMGPGYFPLILAGILTFLGVVIVVRSLRAGTGEIGPVAWRGMLFILPAPIVFGLTVRGLGMVLALVIIVLLVAHASRSMRPLTAACLAVGLTGFCFLVFSYGLGLPLPRFGPWLNF
jgi:uncharacterized membrane protein